MDIIILVVVAAIIFKISAFIICWRLSNLLLQFVCQKWTHCATPQTVQRGLACFQCRSPSFGLEFFGKLPAWSGYL